MQFDLKLLFMPALVIFFATGGVTLKVTRSVVFSSLAALVKSGVFLLYFGVLFDGTFTFDDDWKYLEIGQIYYDANVGITTIMDDFDFVTSESGGDHFLYSLYNRYAFQLFGFGYYAPVALNILLTILIAWFGANLAEIEFNFNGVWKKWFFAFLLFHPDIFAWSNIMNGKDILVLLMHILLLFAVSMFFRGRLLISLVLFFFAVIPLYYLRFYVPLLFAIAFAVNLFLMKKNIKNLWILFSGFFFLLLFSLSKDYNLQDAMANLQEDPIDPIYGFFHFILTPIPFGTSMDSSFLDIPALIHWLFIPFVIIGIMIMLLQFSNYTRFFLLYILVFVALYSCFASEQGPRHRVQIDFAWAVLQFTGLKYFIHSTCRSSWKREASSNAK